MPLDPAVRAAVIAFQAPIEGRVAWMYADIKGFVTTAIGCLIDPVESALPLPWTSRSTGKAATADDVRAEWTKVKNSPETMRQRGGLAYGAVTDLRLSSDAVDAVVGSKIDPFYGFLTQKFPKFDQFPGDAQLGIFSLAWAMGPLFSSRFPIFTAAANQNTVKGWLACAGLPGDPVKNAAVRGESWIDTGGNPGVVKRNLMNRACFYNAAAVAGGQAPPGIYFGTPDSAPSA